jgi:hydrophobe/amphiphile efflux-3 (HAE3) family protein
MAGLAGIARAVVRRPLLVIACVAAVSALMAMGVAKLSMTTDFSEFLPQDNPSVMAKLAFEEEFGRASYVKILVEGDDVTRAEAIRAIMQLEDMLSTDEDLENFVAQVEAYTDYVIPPILSLIGRTLPPDLMLENAVRALLEKPEVAERVVGKLISSDRKAALINVTLKGELTKGERSAVIDALKRLVRDFNSANEQLRARMTGDIVVHEDIYDMMGRDNRILIPAAVVFVLVILFFAFGRASDVLIAILIISLGSMWALGIMGHLGLSFTAFHVALVPLILGLGVDYAIYMLNRYYQERRKGLPTEGAIFTSVTVVGVAVSTSAITTMVGFSSFMTSKLVPFRTLGAFAALGILFNLILSLTLLPALLAIRDRRRAGVAREVVGGGRVSVKKLVAAVALAADRHWKPVMVGVTLLTIACAISAIGIPTTMSVELFLPKDIESVATAYQVSERFGQRSMIFVLAKGEVTTLRALEEMLSLQRAVLDDPRNSGKSLITGSWSLADAVVLAAGGELPNDEGAISEAIQRLDPATRAMLLRGDRAVIYFFVSAMTDKEGELATQIVRSHVRAHVCQALDLTIDGEPAVGGETVVLSDILGSIGPTLYRSTALTILLCFVVLMLFFRSPAKGLIALLPLLLTLSWEFGTLRLLGWPLDVLTMGISALIIGLGVDYTVHVIYRFEEERKRADPREAAGATLASIGTAILSAAATTIGVFAVLSLSGMPAMRRFGILTALVISYGLVAALVILPPILILRGLREHGSGSLRPRPQTV